MRDLEKLITEWRKSAAKNVSAETDWESVS
jgi:hypothetical protein